MSNVKIPKYFKTTKEKQAYLSLVQKGLIQNRESLKSAVNPVQKELLNRCIDEDTTTSFILRTGAFKATDDEGNTRGGNA